jgi:SPP1 family predicted phage head-tail adaptor
VIGQIGQLDRRIKLQFPRTSADAQGSPVTEWQDTAEVWAKAASLPGATETTNGNAREAIADCQFVIRYQRSIAGTGPDFRVLFQNQYYDIISIVPDPIGRPDKLIITARRSADGPACVFPESYILDGEGGRVSDGDGGFITENQP